MAKKSLIIPTGRKSSIEEDIYIEKYGILKYSLSNSLDDIKIAIITRTGKYIDLEKALWHLNPGLSINVKQLMNSHNVNYSMTTYIFDKTNVLGINMRAGDDWYFTSYDEIEGEFINSEFIRTYKMAHQMVKDMLNIYIPSAIDEMIMDKGG
jgi:hypothetical protein